MCYNLKNLMMTFVSIVFIFLLIFAFKTSLNEPEIRFCCENNECAEQNTSVMEAINLESFKVLYERPCEELFEDDEFKIDNFGYLKFEDVSCNSHEYCLGDHGVILICSSK